MVCEDPMNYSYQHGLKIASPPQFVCKSRDKKVRKIDILSTLYGKQFWLKQLEKLLTEQVYDTAVK